MIDTVIDTANGPWSHGRHEDEHDWPFVAVSSPFRPRFVAIDQERSISNVVITA